MENTTVQAYIDQGNALYSQGRLDGAILRYMRAIDLDANCSDAYNNWGFALAAQGKLDEAMEQYKRATEVNPTFSHAFYNWGNALRRIGRYDEAIHKYKKAIETNPNYSLAYNNWGVTLDAQGKYDEAIDKYSKAVEINPNYSQAYNNWGFALDAQGKYEEAITKYARATTIDPNYSDAFDNWGNALAAQGRYSEAIMKYSQAVTINHKNSEAHYNWGLALHYQGKFDEAISKYTKAVDCNPNYILAYFSWVLALYQQNRITDAMYVRVQAFKVMGKDPQSQLELSGLVNAELARAKNKLSKAKNDAERNNLEEMINGMTKMLELFLQKAKDPIQQSNSKPEQNRMSYGGAPISRDSQPEQRPLFPDPQVGEYYGFLCDELKSLFRKSFVQKNGKLEEKYDALVSIINWIAGFLPPLSSISNADKVLPSVSKMAPNGIKLEDIIQIKRVNKIYQRFVGHFASLEELDEISEKVSENLAVLRKEEILSNYVKGANFKVQDIMKRAKERGLSVRAHIASKAEEYAILDFYMLVLLCFLEGMKVANYSNDKQKVDNIVKVISVKMRAHIDKQKENKRLQSEWWNF